MFDCIKLGNYYYIHVNKSMYRISEETYFIQLNKYIERIKNEH